MASFKFRDQKAPKTRLFTCPGSSCEVTVDGTVWVMGFKSGARIALMPMQPT
jgi:hypothetical protein